MLEESYEVKLMIMKMRMRAVQECMGESGEQMKFDDEECHFVLSHENLKWEGCLVVSLVTVAIGGFGCFGELLSRRSRR